MGFRGGWLTQDAAVNRLLWADVRCDLQKCAERRQARTAPHLPSDALIELDLLG